MLDEISCTQNRKFPSLTHNSENESFTKVTKHTVCGAYVGPLLLWTVLSRSFLHHAFVYKSVFSILVVHCAGSCLE